MKEIKGKKPKYYLDANAEFVIENYNFAKPFANFFPGIAGKYGIPMWVFYVNRGQAISSFGTRDKDHAILEFFPANKAWQLTPSQGFRTFIKAVSRKNTDFYEPFHNDLANLRFETSNRMRISSYGLKLEEDNLSLGLQIKVEYFNIPQDSYAGLVRIVSVKNTSKAVKKIQVLDGLPQIIPFGTSNLFLKKLGRTIEAWMNAENMDKGVPFYKLAVDPTDRPEVIHISEGNFYLSFYHEGRKAKIIKPIIDPQHIFGQINDFSLPLEFLENANFGVTKNETVRSKTPCGFSLIDLELSAGKEKTFYTVIGYMRSQEELNSSIKKIASLPYILQKREENKKVIEELQSDIETRSNSREFDLYAKQTYLDNIIRGGLPVIFSRGGAKQVFYMYARKHGDLERDYNKFYIQPSYFSQGNGNYRDMNQNRRLNTWFNPDIEDENIVYFFNLIQTDGFNPLVVKGANFLLKNITGFRNELKNLTDEKCAQEIISFLDNRPFTPGEVIFFLKDRKIKLECFPDELLNLLICSSIKIQEAEHGEGFWTDHWTYALDLLDSYLGIYPEKLKEIIFEARKFTFFDNTETVKPRSEKYLLDQGKVKQLHSLKPDNHKRELIKKRAHQPHLVRTQNGEGEIYQTCLINKLLCLLVNKLSSLDPAGIGIEMEADKPNWFDALNGLPGLLGSSSCETFELKRLIKFIKQAIESAKVKKIYVTEEIHGFLTDMDKLTESYLCDSSADRDYQYWDKSHNLKEDYRNKTRYGVSGKELELAAPALIAILDNALKKIKTGLTKAFDSKRGVYYSYFINEVKEHKIIKEHFVMPKKFTLKKLPLFLEGQMHALRLSENLKEAGSLYKGTKLSSLYDKNLESYKVTAPLGSEPLEIGRCRVFTPGWLENESIWLHMEYKYLLEVLKSGLYEEFYRDFKNALVPFQDPQKYGRSILENSSFMVSSAFPDKRLHGNGFVARLSGSTAEFLQMWLIMNAGKTPFFLNERNELNLRLEPLLAGWLFDRRGDYGFNFLGKVLVVYHNPKRKDTFGSNSVKPKKIIFNDASGNPKEITSGVIPAPFSEQVRSRKIKRIDVYLE